MPERPTPDPRSGFCHWPSVNDPDGSHAACPRTAETCECHCHTKEEKHAEATDR